MRFCFELSINHKERPHCRSSSTVAKQEIVGFSKLGNCLGSCWFGVVFSRQII